jgi:Holliday junction resolvase RusA-like endonuclease
MPWVLGEVIRIEVPGKPKPMPRQRHRIVRPKGKKEFVGNYMPTESRNEQAVLRDFAQQQMNGRSPFDGPVDLRVVAYMPVSASWSKKKQALALADKIRPISRPDGTNMLRLAEDAFKHVVYRDDSQISDFGVWKRYSDRPRLIIEARPLVYQD